MYGVKWRGHNWSQELLISGAHPETHGNNRNARHPAERRMLRQEGGGGPCCG